MELFFSPFACSLAGRIAVYEAGLDETVTFRLVDFATKRTDDGTDYRSINSLGQVPALRTREGFVLTENLAILLYMADQAPRGRLAPADGLERYQLIRWLSFIGSELHMRVFKALVSTNPNEGAKQVAREAAPARLAYLNDHLAGRHYMLDEFTVADAALVAVLNWARYLQMEMTAYPAISEYHARMITRPAIARAIADEMNLRQAA